MKSVLLALALTAPFAPSALLRAQTAPANPPLTSTLSKPGAEPLTMTPAPAGPVIPKITYNSVYVDGPYIAMTFDDGPHAKLTPRLLDLLAQRKIKATFFVCGENVQEYPAIMKRMAAEGHEVANHSWSHPNLGKMGDAAVASQLQRTHDAIIATTGLAPTLMRPPYGSFTDRQKRWSHDQFGYKCILWSADPLDWKRPGPATITQRIVNETGNGGIILSHDIHAGTIEAMPGTFEALLEKGFRFVTVSELLAMEKPQPPRPPAPPKAPKKLPSEAAPGTPDPAAVETVPSPAGAAFPAR